MAIRHGGDAAGILYHAGTGLSISAFTIALRVYPIALVQGNAYGIIAGRSNGPLMELYNAAGSGLGANAKLSRGSSVDDIAGSLSASANTWYHAAWVREATNDVMYLDGAQSLATTKSGYTAGQEFVMHQYSTGAGNRSGYGLDGRFMAVKVWNASLTQAEIQAEMDSIQPRRWESLWAWYPMLSDATRNKDFSGNGRDLTEAATVSNEAEDTIRWGRRRGRFQVPYVSSGVSLTVDDATIGLAAESPSLTQANVLAVNDANVALAAEAPGLVQQNTLAVNDAQVALTAEAPSLTQANLLVVADALVALSAESPTLSLAALLDVADALIGLSADSPALTQANVLSIGDAVIALSAESPTLVQGFLLGVADALIELHADHVTLHVDGARAILASRLRAIYAVALLIDRSTTALLTDRTTSPILEPAGGV